MTFIELIRYIFLTPDEPRLRAGWRLLAQGLLTIAFTFVLAIPMMILISVFPESQELSLVLLGGIPIVLAVLAARKWIDRRSIGSLGLKRSKQALRDVLAGFGIALAQIALIFGIQLGFGWARVSGFAWQEQAPLAVLGGLTLGLATHLAVGFYEELLSRGYQLQNLEEGTNTFWAVTITSVAFGAAHLLNPNASLVSMIGISLAGFYLALGYLRTRQLWLPIGMHFGWNFFLGPVFGFPVSGLDFFHLIRVEVTGPELATGGAFGPEAGLVVIPGLALGALLVLLYTRGRLVKNEDTDEG